MLFSPLFVRIRSRTKTKFQFFGSNERLFEARIYLRNLRRFSAARFADDDETIVLSHFVDETLTRRINRQSTPLLGQGHGKLEIAWLLRNARTTTLTRTTNPRLSSQKTERFSSFGEKRAAFIRVVAQIT